MSRPILTGYKDQINVKLHKADKLMLKRAFSIFCAKNGAYNSRGNKRSFNEFCRRTLLKRAVQVVAKNKSS